MFVRSICFCALLNCFVTKIFHNQSFKNKILFLLFFVCFDLFFQTMFLDFSPIIQRLQYTHSFLYEFPLISLQTITVRVNVSKVLHRTVRPIRHNAQHALPLTFFLSWWHQQHHCCVYFQKNHTKRSHLTQTLSHISINAIHSLIYIWIRVHFFQHFSW